MQTDRVRACFIDIDLLEGGAARGTRTPDPVITNDVLYQLSYCGEPFGNGLIIRAT